MRKEIETSRVRTSSPVVTRSRVRRKDEDRIGRRELMIVKESTQDRMLTETREWDIKCSRAGLCDEINTL